MRRLGAPRRMVSVLEGEGLFNDASALVAYRVAVTAVVAGSFSLAHAGIAFVTGALRGIDQLFLYASALGYGIASLLVDDDGYIWLTPLTESILGQRRPSRKLHQPARAVGLNERECRAWLSGSRLPW
jgi:NhaP-type Na+/H+ or K+/H+ antiporter